MPTPQKLWNLDIFEALCFVILLESLGSIYYHVCPSLRTFQFDEAFMTPIAHLCTMVMVQGDFTPMAYFVYVLGPLWFFNSVGSCYDVGSMHLNFVYALFMCAMLCWAWYVYNFLTEDWGTVHELTIQLPFISDGYTELPFISHSHSAPMPLPLSPHSGTLQKRQLPIELRPGTLKVSNVAGITDQVKIDDIILEINGAEARDHAGAMGAMVLLARDAPESDVRITVRRHLHQGPIDTHNQHSCGCFACALTFIRDWKRIITVAVAPVLALYFLYVPSIMQAIGGTANFNFYVALGAIARVGYRQMHFERDRYLLYLANVPAAIMAVVGVSIFLTEKVNNVLGTPAQSRMQNKPCVVWPFYDIHDVWHVLSAVCLGEFVRGLIGANVHAGYFRAIAPGEQRQEDGENSTAPSDGTPPDGIGERHDCRSACTNCRSACTNCRSACTIS